MNHVAYRLAFVAVLVASCPVGWAQLGAGDSASVPPDVSTLPDDPYGRLVHYGKELSERTFAYLGPQVKDPTMRYAGNNLACASCHEGAGTKKFAMAWIGVHSMFPQYRAREDAVDTLQDRINGCMERSMNGKPLPVDSQEMKAFLTYMHFLSRGVPVGARVEGEGLPAFSPPARPADPIAGAKVYQEKCVACHGANGAGVPAEAGGYTFPPLWGTDSFNNGAGMARLLFAAAFVKTNMPLGTAYGQPQLSDDEAYDVVAYVLSHARPMMANLERDFPARWNKPVDAAFPPYVDGASAEQHKYGPFQPLQDNMKKLRPASAQ